MEILCFHEAPASLVHSRAEEDLQPDPDEDHAAKDGRLIRELHAEAFPEEEPCDADGEGHDADDDTCEHRFGEGVLRQSEADRERVHGGREPLDQEVAQAHADLDVLFFSGEPVADHEPADGDEQDQRCPRHEREQDLKKIDDPVHTRPACHRHQPLEEAEGPRDETHGAKAEEMIRKAIRKRDGKGVHRKSHAEQDTVQNK